MKHKPDFQKKYKTFDKTAENSIISRVTVNIHTMRDIVRLCIPLMKNSAKDFPWCQAYQKACKYVHKVSPPTAATINFFIS